MGPNVERLTSPDNPLLQQVRRLVSQPGAYRREGAVWLEGEHLVHAAVQAGRRLAVLLLLGDGLDAPPEWRAAADRCVQLPPQALRRISELPSSVRVAAIVALQHPPALQTHAATLVLDRVQDAGNVGSMLRSAAAFGCKQILALKGTSALWSPKVMRAAQGAHFALALHEGVDVDALQALTLPLLATSSHEGIVLGEAPLPQPCAWIFGNEGQGVASQLLARATLKVRIAQPGGEESLNVAAAAAICLHESARGHSPH